jgi:hypothetical protein
MGCCVPSVLSKLQDKTLYSRTKDTVTSEKYRGMTVRILSNVTISINFVLRKLNAYQQICSYTVTTPPTNMGAFVLLLPQNTFYLPSFLMQARGHQK